VIEGNYDKNNEAKKIKIDAGPAADLQYVFERFCEGDLDRRIIVPEHFEELHKKELISIDKKIIQIRMQQLLGSTTFSESELYKFYESGTKVKAVDDDKPNLMRIAVIEYFKTLKDGTKQS